MPAEEYRLFKEIMKLSESNEWKKAVLEWEWTATYFIDPKEDPETCLCGHHPIRECCIITNKENGAREIVGNCCINKFMDTESDLIFKAIKRVSQDIKKSFNIATIEYAHEKKIITDWEYNFYKDIRNKRKLTSNQYSQKLRINKIILDRLRKTKSVLERPYIKNEKVKESNSIFDF